MKVRQCPVTRREVASMIMIIRDMLFRYTKISFICVLEIIFDYNEQNN